MLSFEITSIKLIALSPYARFSSDSADGPCKRKPDVTSAPRLLPRVRNSCKRKRPKSIAGSLVKALLARFRERPASAKLYEVTAPATRRRARGPSQNRSYYTAIVSPVPYRSSVSSAVEEDAPHAFLQLNPAASQNTSPQNPIGRLERFTRSALRD